MALLTPSLCLVILTCFFVDFIQIYALFFYTSKNITIFVFFDSFAPQSPIFIKNPLFSPIFLHIFTFLSFLVNAQKCRSQGSVFYPRKHFFAVIRILWVIMISTHIMHGILCLTEFYTLRFLMTECICFVFNKKESRRYAGSAYFSFKKEKVSKRKW